MPGINSATPIRDQPSPQISSRPNVITNWRLLSACRASLTRIGFNRSPARSSHWSTRPHQPRGEANGDEAMSLVIGHWSVVRWSVVGTYATIGHSRFVIRHSSFFRHWVFRHSSFPAPCPSLAAPRLHCTAPRVTCMKTSSSDFSCVANSAMRKSARTICFRKSACASRPPS